MPVERVLITPNLMRLRNSSNGIVFDTTNRYIKTDAGSSFSVTAMANAPFPIGNVAVESYGGYGIWKGMMINRSVNERAYLPRVANDGWLEFRVGILVSGYGTGNYYGTTTPSGWNGVIIGYREDGENQYPIYDPQPMWTYIGQMFEVVRNGSVMWTFHLHRQNLFNEVSDGESSTIQKGGERFYISGTTTVATNGFSFGPYLKMSVDEGDVVYIKFLRNVSQGNAAYNGEYVVMYYTDEGTLPLALTS